MPKVFLNHDFLLGIAHRTDLGPTAVALLDSQRRLGDKPLCVHPSLSTLETGAGPFIQWANRARGLADEAKRSLAEALLRLCSGARKLSGYPRGMRHELASLALIESDLSVLGDDIDQDLVLHLVASHHGYCRPFAPIAEEDPSPVELSIEVDGKGLVARSDHALCALDSGVTERFFRLTEQYGWFGLAWLEALLRLADHRRSQEEQQNAFREGAS